jgi:hypothetical protein
MVYDGNVHLAMNGMRSVGSVTGNGTAVNELSHSSPATFLHANLMVALDSQIAQRVSQLYFVCYLEDGASLQAGFEDFMQINRPGHKLRKVCNPNYEVVVSLGNKRA